MQRVSAGVITGLTVAFLAFMTISATGQTGGKPEGKELKNPVASNEQSVKAGGSLYQRYCRSCHGADAKGNGPMAPKDSNPPDLTDDDWVHGATDGEIFMVVRDGAGPRSVMKGHKSRMTEQEMWRIVNYLRSLAPKAQPQ
jgi:mono/diheme cytochrome c family protein